MLLRLKKRSLRCAYSLLWSGAPSPPFSLEPLTLIPSTLLQLCSCQTIFCIFLAHCAPSWSFLSQGLCTLFFLSVMPFALSILWMLMYLSYFSSSVTSQGKLASPLKSNQNMIGRYTPCSFLCSLPQVNVTFFNASFAREGKYCFCFDHLERRDIDLSFCSGPVDKESSWILLLKMKWTT